MNAGTRTFLSACPKVRLPPSGVVTMPPAPATTAPPAATSHSPLVARRGQITSREIAATLNITERSVLRIIKDLEDGGYLHRFRDGRQNYYQVDANAPLRREDARHVAVVDLLSLLAPANDGEN